MNKMSNGNKNALIDLSSLSSEQKLIIAIIGMVVVILVAIALNNGWI
jgi:hypothetical protein